MYLLDTNHCSQAIQGNANVLSRLAEYQNESIATCAIVQGELLDMGERSQQRQSNLILIRQFLNSIDIYPIDSPVAEVYGSLKASVFNQFAPRDRSQRRRYQLQNIGFTDNDLWIAAIAIHHNLTLVSADSDFSRVQQVQALTVESWI